MRLTRPVKAWLEVDGYVLPDCVNTTHISLTETTATLIVTAPSEEMKAVSLGRNFEIAPQSITVVLEGLIHARKGRLKDRLGWPSGYAIAEQIPGVSVAEGSALLQDSDLNQILTLVPPGQATDSNQFAVHSGGEIEVSANLTQGQTIVVSVPATYPETCRMVNTPLEAVTLNLVGWDNDKNVVLTRYAGCTLAEKRLQDFNSSITIELLLPREAPDETVLDINLDEALDA